MSTESNIEHLYAFAERYSEIVFDQVHQLVKGIALQGVWKNAFGEPVYTQDVTFEIIYGTVLEIFMGDSALFAMETRLDIAVPI